MIVMVFIYLYRIDTTVGRLKSFSKNIACTSKVYFVGLVVSTPSNKV